MNEEVLTSKGDKHFQGTKTKIKDNELWKRPEEPKPNKT